MPAIRVLINRLRYLAAWPFYLIGEFAVLFGADRLYEVMFWVVSVVSESRTMEDAWRDE